MAYGLLALGAGNAIWGMVCSVEWRRSLGHYLPPRQDSIPQMASVSPSFLTSMPRASLAGTLSRAQVAMLDSIPITSTLFRLTSPVRSINPAISCFVIYNYEDTFCTGSQP